MRQPVMSWRIRICVKWFIMFVWHDSLHTVTHTPGCDVLTYLYTCDMTHYVCAPWLITYHSPCASPWRQAPIVHIPCHPAWYMCDMTHSYMWHDSLMHVTWLIDTCNMTYGHPPLVFRCTLRDTCVCDMCAMTHPYLRHDSWIHVTWLIHTRDMTHGYSALGFGCTLRDTRVICVWCVWHVMPHVMSRVTCMNESCPTSHIWTGHVTCHIYQRVVSHVQMSHVTCMDESCHMYEWVMPHVWMSHVTSRRTLVLKTCWSGWESPHMHEWVKSHVWMRHVTCIHEPRHMCTWTTSHVWMSHVTCMNESWHI